MTEITDISNGQIEAATGATSPNGTALKLTLKPLLMEGQVNMNWTLSGTICDNLRGIRIGEYGCVAPDSAAPLSPGQTQDSNA